MSGRRAGNVIRGPQSALTDFLASHNISAAQIRLDYERRRSQANTSAPPADNEEGNEEQTEEVDAKSEDDDSEAPTKPTKKRKRHEPEVIGTSKKSKKSLKAQKKEAKKAAKKNKRGDDSESEDEYLDSSDDEIIRGAYKKARPPPGQFANCEVCSKRFTVTPYSKDGPEGGLLCTPCGKNMAKDLKAENKAAAKPVSRKKRKQESDKIDGLAARGAKSLQQMCIEKVVANHTEVDELGDLPQPVLEQLSLIFGKKRVLKPNTLPLFLRPDVQDVIFHDAADLEVDNYKEIFAVTPGVKRLILGNAGQFKNEVVEYMLERCKNIQHLQIYSPNLVSNEMWSRLFTEIGDKLEVVKLTWLDASFVDQNVAEIIQCCPKLHRLKLKYCRQLTEQALVEIAKARKLEHLSLQITHQIISNEILLDMIMALAPRLRTLSLEKFLDADDTILEAIHAKCERLSKFRLVNNDTVSDAGFATLFDNWKNPPLKFIDVNCTRDIDHNKPEGPEDAIGMASTGFRALMAHSGSALKHLDIASCRHIELAAFLDVFNGGHVYPALEFLNISFCNVVDNSVIGGIFKSCPALKKLVAFGCFDIGEVVVPRDIALIGIPKAQDAIEQFGTGMNVEEALHQMQDMIEIAA